VELRLEGESGHRRRRLLAEARQSRDGRRSRGAERHSRAFRRGRELRRAQSVWGAWADGHRQVHRFAAEGCTLVRPPILAHRLGGRDRRLAVPAELGLLEEGSHWNLGEAPGAPAEEEEPCIPDAARSAA
jgi:hypothetical protein